MDGRVNLAGAIAGRKAMAQLLEHIDREPAAPEVLYLDFEGIELATGSFLREAVLHFRDSIRRRGSRFYPVVANANNLVVEEFEVLLANRRDVLMLCSVDKNGEPSSPRLVGDLDPKQRSTLEKVLERQETDAGELMNAFGESEGVKQTAFNNRLSALAEMGLVIEVSNGRLKRYRALFEKEVSHGA
jgi:DNA-binding transcriptional ArsR family regulator